jgi:hypothetical protein
MSKIVYVERPERMIEPPQRVWVREEDQPVPSPDDPADYVLDAHHPHFSLQTEADVRAWMAYMFHPSALEGMPQVCFV